ncbi:class I SAM-dependent methyltransferase [Roseomonas xinghualingensis]|uniref:class I SAM-dependent methyltransferase n=1 Tax=Roseomonas xinghualingensis TaxID=2986475 RepID=UPI0021F0D6C6|nr:class I SAM-dependent methyltransferase [Roseomonas sp. SXEYE001]MCV4207878.1 class I SAM-dependent methyltransferase [Roseomonas sp. SXEYE001]
MAASTLQEETARLNAIAGLYADFTFDKLMRGYMLRRFRPYLPASPEGRRALEMGCHHGAFSVLIEPLFETLEVVDVAEAFLERTRTRLSPRAILHHALFEQFEAAPRFDAIFLSHVLEHLIDPVLVLARAREWLLPGGRMLIAVPNGLAPSRQIAVEMGLFPACTSFAEADIREGHRRVYLPDTLAADIRTAGLRIVDRGGILFKPLANFQMDRGLETGLISDAYLEGCYQLGLRYPDLCASLFIVAERDGGA